MVTSTFAPVAPAQTTLAPYTGPWTALQAGHLLRRATFAPNKTELDQALANGLTGSINRLFTPLDLPANPFFVNYDSHPDAGIGDDWYELHLNPASVEDDKRDRRLGLATWWINSTANRGFNICEKMVLFWVNHFGMGTQDQFHTKVRYHNRYRTFATGNFRELMKLMTIDVYMLGFLNGRSNTRTNPNENFAREFLELYTIGKGPDAGDGDYTTYTEQDVTELARAFTGWRTRYINSRNPGEIGEAYYTSNRHDTEDKTLSYRLNNAVITNGEELEYQQVVDLLFTFDEVAYHISRKLYRHFVYHELTNQVEQNIIAPMAQLIIDNDYVIEPALRALLSSEHFYQDTFIGAMIKTPLDFAQSVLRNTGFYDQGNIYDNAYAQLQAYNHTRNTGMDLQTPPSVAGWTAYYQAPSFHQLWLNTSTIQERVRFVDRATRRWFNWAGERRYVNWLPFVDGLANPYQADTMINETAAILLPRPLQPTQYDYLLDLLLDGQEDFVWTNEYADYRANPNDDMTIDAVSTRLNNMLHGLMQLAEFQLY